MCGDSSDRKTVEEFIGSEKVDMIMTDPPYDMSYSKGGSFSKTVANVCKRLEKLLDFKANNIVLYTELDIPSVYIFTSKSLVKDYLNLFSGYNSNNLVWCKTNPTPFVKG